MGSEALVVTALIIGVMHTLLGPDHYLPFVTLAKARHWSLRKAMAVTAICGVGHIVGSVVLGMLGILAGWSLGSLEWVESIRGEVASWLFIGFGLVYVLWGVRRMRKQRSHTHVHAHADGTIHTHEHSHEGGHVHPHDEAAKSSRGVLLYWSLFVIFVFGPCEALIPMLMYPAVTHSVGLVWAVTLTFSFATVITMVAAVGLLSLGVFSLRHKALSRYGHLFAGTTITLCGLAIQLGF